MSRRWLRCAIAPIAAMAVMAAAVADFSAVRTKADARRLVAAGQLVPVLFFPAEFGGQDVAENRGFITPTAMDSRAVAIARLRGMIERGVLDHMDVTPAYKGDSIVPSHLTMTASKSGSAGEITIRIEVW